MSKPTRTNNLNRREFLKAAGSTAAVSVVRAPRRRISFVVDPADPVASSGPARWAAKELEQSLDARGIAVHKCERLVQAKAGDFCVVAAGSTSNVAAAILKAARATVAETPEALGLAPRSVGDRKVLLACGHDPRGLVYALLDLSDRLQNASDPLNALAIREPITERPANVVRSVMRLFASEVEDKPWYNDRGMWPRYLTMLATHRFNRFNLSLGLGYDFLRRVTDAYFLFAYPFLLAVPGYDVRAPQLPDAERDRNLEMLQFIGEQSVARGLEFQLGIWMHG